MKKCTVCNEEYSNKLSECPNCKNSVVNNDIKPRWGTGRFTISIISMVLFGIISLQSCVVSLGNAISDNGASSGTDGFICGLLMLIAGIVSIATRNSEKKSGVITCIVLYGIAFLSAMAGVGTYGDLAVWGSVSLAFCLVNVCSLLLMKDSLKKLSALFIVLIVLIPIFIIAITPIPDEEKNSNSYTSNSKPQDTKIVEDENSNNTNTTEKVNFSTGSKNKYSLNETFEFDDLEITIGDTISFTKVSNRYSDNNGKTVVKMPITVKNLKDETHSLNMFYYKVFGSQGTETDTVSSYFNETVDYAGDLRTGASYTKYLYFLYDGNGEYAIEFDNYSSKITIEFNINK